MKFTISWLKEFIELSTDNLEEISNTLSKIGFEVEEIIDRREELKIFEVAEIIEAKKHPSADKLQVCTVKTKTGNAQIVCGAPNARPRIKVVLAPIGAVIPNGKFAIKQAKIRDVESNGMLCSSDELFLNCGSEGIIELPTEAIVGEPFMKYCGLDDPMFEISVTPNRGDCLGVIGIARELAAAGLGKLKENWMATSSHDGTVPITKIEIASENDCSAFAICEFSGISNKASPLWLKHRLQNIGLTPISAVVDVTNYICYSLGRPMHAYDKDKLSGNLKVEKAKTGEKFEALSDKIYELSENDVVVRDNTAIQCLAGIIGGKKSACTDSTTSVVLEAAIWNKDLIISSGRKHSIETDARHRLERCTDPALVIPAMELAAKMIREFCGGKASSIKLYGTTEVTKQSISIDEQLIKKATGAPITIKESGSILEKLGFTVNYKGTELTATAPSWRHDISIKEDLIEEIVRIYGFDRIPSVPISSELKFRLMNNTANRGNIARRVMASRGYDELITWSFMHSKFATLFTEVKKELQLQNPISLELDYMRPSIIPNLLDSLNKNINRGVQNQALFEVGPIFLGTDKEDEKLTISGIRYGNIDTNFFDGFREADVFDIKADVEAVMQELGLSLDKTQLTTSNLPKYFHPTRSTAIFLGKNIIGYFGEIHPLTLLAYKIEKRVTVFELNISALPNLRLKYGRRDNYSPSDYQSVTRDFAFLVDRNIPAGDLATYIYGVDKQLLKEVEIFDLYMGDKIPDNKKSIAIRVVLQAADHTLSEEELVKIHQDIISNIGQKFGAELR